MSTINLLTIREFCERNRVSKNTAYREIAANRLRSLKVGKSRRIPVEAEREWIAERIEAATQ